MRAGGDDQRDGEGKKDHDLERTQHHARLGGDPHAAVDEEPHADTRSGGERSPQPDGRIEVVLQENGYDIAEDQVEKRGHERLGEHEAPGDEKACHRVEPSRAIRVQPARRRKMARELADADRHEEACNQGEHHRQRGRASRIRDREDD